MSEWQGGKGSRRRNPNEKNTKKIGKEYLKHLRLKVNLNGLIN